MASEYLELPTESHTVAHEVTSLPVPDVVGVRIGVDVVDGDDGRAGGRCKLGREAAEVIDPVSDQGIRPAGDLLADPVELAGAKGDLDRIPVGPSHASALLHFVRAMLSARVQ